MHNNNIFPEVIPCGLTAYIHRDQLRAQRSVTSMGELYLSVVDKYSINREIIVD